MVSQDNGLSRQMAPPETTHLLVVDDDSRLRLLLSRYLRDEGFAVSTVESVSEALKAFGLFTFDLMVLDVMMPEISGLALLENPPAHCPPIILLTAQGSVEERIEGLALGADDYIAKPFEPRELSLRIQAVLKRTRKEKARHSLGGLSFDVNRGLLFKGETALPLTVGEQKLLSFLITHQGSVLSRERIAAALGEGVSLRTVDVQINRLRQKIEPTPSQPLYLQSLRGLGYRLRCDA
jgi:two-component system phosphate regulon response regulator OmpR